MNKQISEANTSTRSMLIIMQAVIMVTAVIVAHYLSTAMSATIVVIGACYAILIFFQIKLATDNVRDYSNSLLSVTAFSLLCYAVMMAYGSGGKYVVSAILGFALVSLIGEFLKEIKLRKES